MTNTNEENLWGEINTDEIFETPLGILKSQAVALGKASKGLLNGRVVQFDVSHDDSRGELGYELRITVPALSNYSIAVVSVFQARTLYPAIVIADLEHQTMPPAATPEELKSFLRRVLQSDKIKTLIRALIAQVNEISDSSPKGVTKSDKY